MCQGVLLQHLVWGELAVLHRGPSKPPCIAQARPIFKHGTVLCFWVEPSSRCILLFHRWEEHIYLFDLNTIVCEILEQSVYTYIYDVLFVMCQNGCNLVQYNIQGGVVNHAKNVFFSMYRLSCQIEPYFRPEKYLLMCVELLANHL